MKPLLLFLLNRLLPLVLLLPAASAILVTAKLLQNQWHTIPVNVLLFFFAIPLIRLITDRFFNKNKIHNPFSLADTLEHEFTHAFWGILFLNPPGKVQAASDGNGFVEFRGSNTLILLAPYFFPFWSFCLLPLYFITATEFIILIRMLHAGCIANYLLRLLRELRFWQPDIKQSGRLYSAIWISALLPLFLCWHLWIISGLSSALYWTETLRYTLRLIPNLLNGSSGVII